MKAVAILALLVCAVAIAEAQCKDILEMVTLVYGCERS